jgi:hypothetical protein
MCRERPPPFVERLSGGERPPGARRRGNVQYLLLIYGDERALDAEREGRSEDQAMADMQPWFDYTDWLLERGWMKGGDPLAGTEQATSVRIREGERVVTDGPFAETKEQLGGYYLIEVDHLDDAIEAAARCPGALFGTIEVRPVMSVRDAETTEGTR